MKFNWEGFMNEDNDIAVHCETEEEAIDFCKQMDEHGMRWWTGISYLDHNNWKENKEKTCYTNNGKYAPISFYKEKNYKILEWSDYMKKDPIDYLEYGYMVEFEDGRFAIYMPTQKGDYFDYMTNGGCLSIYEYNNKLEYEYKCFKNIYNVKRIYGYTNCPYRTTQIDIESRPLIWERLEEVKKMTVSEICKELGYKVEIVEG